MGKIELVQRVGITKEEGYLYFVSREGDIMRTKMARGRGKRKR